jgi:hypothetical protein
MAGMVGTRNVAELIDVAWAACRGGHRRSNRLLQRPIHETRHDRRRAGLSRPLDARAEPARGPRPRWCAARGLYPGPLTKSWSGGWTDPAPRAVLRHGPIDSRECADAAQNAELARSIDGGQPVSPVKFAITVLKVLAHRRFGDA